MASGIGSPVGIIGIILLIIGVIMIIVGVILLIIDSQNMSVWYVWVLLGAGLIISVVGAIMVGYALYSSSATQNTLVPETTEKITTVTKTVPNTIVPNSQQVVTTKEILIP